MYYDDYLAQQVLRTADRPYPRLEGPPPLHRLLRAAWRGVRQVAWGIDASSSVRHGVPVPPDHGARRRRDHVGR